MNQQIIFNDDICFDDHQQGWIFTGLLSGERINIFIKSKKHTELNNALKFDLEELVEQWLEENEPPTNNKISL